MFGLIVLGLIFGFALVVVAEWRMQGPGDLSIREAFRLGWEETHLAGCYDAGVGAGLCRWARVCLDGSAVNCIEGGHSMRVGCPHHWFSNLIWWAQPTLQKSGSSAAGARGPHQYPIEPSGGQYPTQAAE